MMMQSLDLLEEEIGAITAVCVSPANIEQFLTAEELDDEDQNFVNKNIGVRDQLSGTERELKN
jgi:hypothetical protein